MTDLELLWLKTISEDPKMIAYRPRLRPIAGSITATILLQQIIYRWVHNDYRPFYKYKEPCAASDYREGDSWCEELGFSREEFDTALKHIGQKVSRNVTKDTSKLVWYWTMPNRKTWYEVNYPALCGVAIPLYVSSQRPVTKTGDPASDIYTKKTSKKTSKKTIISDDDDAFSSLVKADLHVGFIARGDHAHDATRTALLAAANEQCAATIGNAWDNWPTYRDRLTNDELHLFCYWCKRLACTYEQSDSIHNPAGFVRDGVKSGALPGLIPSDQAAVDIMIDSYIDLVKQGLFAVQEETQ